MRESTLVGIMTTLAMSTLAISLFVAATPVPIDILSAYADRDGKKKIWIAEDDSAGAIAECTKDHDCKGFNANKEARELCNEISEVKCKQEKIK
jgi:hypothetical protein